ncbi:MAG: DUF4252 domain-containing protein [Saprospiraceae bacterium]|nr:DUF4252 domain-containing protein [Saprospiraceae bacterium]
MKRILTIAALLFSFGLAQAQNNSAHKLFDKYEDQDGFTSVIISEYAFQLLANVMEGEEEAFEEAARMITGVRILVAEDAAKGPSFLADLEKTFNFKTGGYQPLMTVKSDGDQVLFYLREQGKKITEFVLLVQEPTSPVMILIEGNDIDLKKLKNIAGNTEIDLLDELDDIELDLNM